MLFLAHTTFCKWARRFTPARACPVYVNVTWNTFSGVLVWTEIKTDAELKCSSGRRSLLFWNCVLKGKCIRMDVAIDSKCNTPDIGEATSISSTLDDSNNPWMTSNACVRLYIQCQRFLQFRSRQNCCNLYFQVCDWTQTLVGLQPHSIDSNHCNLTTASLYILLITLCFGTECWHWTQIMRCRLFQYEHNSLILYYILD